MKTRLFQRSLSNLLTNGSKDIKFGSAYLSSFGVGQPFDQVRRFFRDEFKKAKAALLKLQQVIKTGLTEEAEDNVLKETQKTLLEKLDPELYNNSRQP